MAALILCEICRRGPAPYVYTERRRIRYRCEALHIRHTTEPVITQEQRLHERTVRSAAMQLPLKSGSRSRNARILVPEGCRGLIVAEAGGREGVPAGTFTSPVSVSE